TWPLPRPQKAHHGVPQVRKGLLALIPRASEGRGRDLHRPGDAPPALAHSPSATEIFDIDHPRLPPEPDALGAGSGLPAANTLTNPLPFRGGHPTKAGREKTPPRPTGIEPRLLVAHDADPRRSQLSHVSGHGPDTLST